MEDVEKLCIQGGGRLIGEKFYIATRYGVYCFDSTIGQGSGFVIREEKANMAGFKSA